MLSKLLVVLMLFYIHYYMYNREYRNEDDFVEMVFSKLGEVAGFSLPEDNSNLYNISSEDLEEIEYGSFDFVIIGAGAAGSVLASRLSEVGHWNILLLEAGGEENEFREIPAMSPYLQWTEMNWGYRSKPQTTCCLGMEGNVCNAPRGKVIGGSSSIGDNMWVRGNKEDYDHWARLGNPGWSYEDVLPYFKKIEKCVFDNVNIEYRGTEGLLYINHTEPTMYADLFLKACQEIGQKLCTDHNGEDQLGAGVVQYYVRDGKSQSASRAYLDPFRTRPNLKITLNAFVTKLLIDEDRKTVCGAQFVKDGKLYVVNATKEVLLAAGAVNSPQILMLSGIGPKKELEDLGIDVINDLPVGKNLQDHQLFVGANFRTNYPLFNESVIDMIKDYLKGHRPLTVTYGGEVQTFVNLKNISSEQPDVQIAMLSPPGLQNGASKGFNLNEKFTQAFADNYQYTTDIGMWVALLHPKSRGSVTLQSKSPLDFPIIDYNYFSDPEGEDIEVLYQGILEAMRIGQSDAFKAVNASYSPPLGACLEFEEFSKEYWYCAIRHISSTMYHLSGTTKMGNSTFDSVVNGDLKVHDMNNLRIIDAGVMPGNISGNILAAVYVIAEKIADHIKRQYNAI